MNFQPPSVESLLALCEVEFLDLRDSQMQPHSAKQWKCSSCTPLGSSKISKWHKGSFREHLLSDRHCESVFTTIYCVEERWSSKDIRSGVLDWRKISSLPPNIQLWISRSQRSKRKGPQLSSVPSPPPSKKRHLPPVPPSSSPAPLSKFKKRPLPPVPPSFVPESVKFSRIAQRFPLFPQLLRPFMPPSPVYLLRCAN